MRLRQARREGLSLIEVLAALAIFLMALVALVHLVNTASNLAFEGHHRANAARICQSKLSEVISGAIPLQGQSDQAVEDEPDYRWSLTAEAGSAQGLYNVTVRVTLHNNDEHPIEVSLLQMVLDPTVAGSTQDVPASSSSSSNTAGSGSGATSNTTGN
jgi:prepilin-type N-terminal cleavage/methylation domain-containing protein